ncbi:MAG: DUF3025 domain-containing protein [Gallionella sp.]
MYPNPVWSNLLHSPLFEPLHTLISNFEAGIFPTIDELNILLDAHQPAILVQGGAELKFVAQRYGKLAFEAQYEPRCYLTGEVQTRTDNWHDLFNALVWLRFPLAKAAINTRHYQSLTDKLPPSEALAEVRSERGTVRDTSTLLDESGIIVAYADEVLAGLLRDFSWKALFWQRREQLQSNMGFYLFGHGLYEKALQPYVGMTAQGLMLAVMPAFFSWANNQQLAYLDRCMADYLSDTTHCRHTRELTPIPLLGVPGWTEDNRCASYYDNTDYFRPGRRKRIFGVK